MTVVVEIAYYYYCHVTTILTTYTIYDVIFQLVNHMIMNTMGHYTFLVYVPLYCSFILCTFFVLFGFRSATFDYEQIKLRNTHKSKLSLFSDIYLNVYRTFAPVGDIGAFDERVIRAVLITFHGQLRY